MQISKQVLQQFGGVELDSVVGELRRHGWTRFNTAEFEMREFLPFLGKLLNHTQVSIVEGSKSLVTSARGLSPHTDHHLARYILWNCDVQQESGGETILVDGLAVFSSMSQADKTNLRNIRLMEHSIFDGDEASHPMIFDLGGNEALYYSYWLCDESISPILRESFDRFHAAVKSVQPIFIRLETGESLLIDNNRMLHGRVPLEQDSPRILQRYWFG